MTQLPTPDPEALAHSQRLQQFIIDEIAAADGWIDRGDLTSVLMLLGIPREEWVWD